MKNVKQTGMMSLCVCVCVFVFVVAAVNRDNEKEVM